MNVDEILEEDKLPIIESKQNPTPFPQANSMEKILEFVLNTDEEGCPLSNYLVLNLMNSERQAAYYINAAIYLGLCQKIGEFYYPTSNGTNLKKAPREERNELLATYALAHQIIGPWYCKIFQFKTREERLHFLSHGFVTDLSAVTIERRCECILSWMKWIQKNLPILDEDRK